MEDSTILAINGIAATTSGTMVAVDPVLLPTTSRVNGMSRINSIKNGILLAGGGALLGGLSKLVERTLKVKCVVAQNPLGCVAKGTAIAFRKVDKLLDGFEHIGVYQYQ